MEWVKGSKHKKLLTPKEAEEEKLKAEVERETELIRELEIKEKDKIKLVQSFCRIEGRGANGSGILVDFLGYTGVLTACEVLPDKLAAREACAIFEPSSGKRMDLALLPEVFYYYSPSSVLNYAFVAAELPPENTALSLQRSKDCGFKVGDRVQLIQVDEVGRSLLTGLVYAIKSPKVTCYLQTHRGATGCVLAKDFKPVALHTFPDDSLESQEGQKGFLSSITCSAPRPKSRSGQTKGVLLSAIMDDLQAQLPRGKDEPPIPRPVPPGVNSPFEFFKGTKPSQNEGGSVSEGKGDRMCSVFGLGGSASASTRRIPEPEGVQGDSEDKESQAKPGSEEEASTKGMRLKIPKAADFTKPKEPDPAEIAAEAQRLKELAEENAVTEGRAEKQGFGLVLEAWQPSGLASALNSLAKTRQTVRVHSVIEGLGAERATPKIDRGDVVITINNEKVNSLKQAKELLIKAGDKVIVQLCRKQCMFQVIVRKPGVDTKEEEEHSAETRDPRDTDGSQTVESRGAARASAKTTEGSPGDSETQEAGTDYSKPLGSVSASNLTSDKTAVSVESKKAPEAMKDQVQGKVQGKPEVNLEVQGSIDSHDTLNKEIAPPRSNQAAVDSQKHSSESGANSAPPASKPTQKARSMFGAGFWGTPAEPLRGRRKPQDSIQQLRQSSTVWMRGIIAQGRNPKELNLELLDKSSVGDAMGIQRLVSLGADPNTTDPLRWGNTPLINAASSGNRMAVELLLKAKADPNACDHWGWTPLHRAAGLKHIEVMIALLRSGARIGVRDSIGLQPRDVAKVAGHLELCAILSDTDKDIVAVLNQLVDGNDVAMASAGTAGLKSPDAEEPRG